MHLFRQPSLDKAEEHFRQGLYYRNRKGREFDFDMAVEHFKEAIKLNPEIGRYHTELGKAYVAAPLLAVTRGIGDSTSLEKCLQLAVDELNQALNCDPSQIDSYLVLGEAYMYMGERQKAVNAFRMATSMPSPSFVDSIFLKSYAKRRLKNLEQGKQKDSQPAAAQECIEQAISYRDEGNYGLAEKKLMQAFNLAPDWAWLYKAICRLAS